MIFETVGCVVEGLAVAGAASGIMLMLGGTGGASGGPGFATMPRAITTWPNLSAIGLDPLTGDVRSGALTVQLNASATICALFARQARARKVDATLNAATTPSATTLDLSAITIAIFDDDLLYLDDELVRVVGLVAGTIWTVERGYGATLATGHAAGANIYRAPPFWIGRALTLYKLQLEAVNQGIISSQVIWRGYLTDAPTVGSSVTSVTLKAEDALAALRRSTINRAPYRHLPAVPLVPYVSNDGSAALTGHVPAETGNAFDTSVHRRFPLWIADGAVKALMVSPDSVMISIADNLVLPGKPVSGSKPLVADELLDGDVYEVALWDERLDIFIQDELGYGGVAPTLRCAYPYHPLTIAAALLFSDPYESDEDPLAYNVMHQSCTLGVGFLANYTAWDNLIRKTSHLKVGRLALFAGGQPSEVFNFLTQQLLPAYGFLIAADAEGRLRPIQVGLADVGEVAGAPLVTPIAGTWEWQLSSAGALDAIDAVIGELPWAPGRRVEVSAQGVREPSSGSRSTRLSRRSEVTVKYPSIEAAQAESYGSTRLANILAWRYDGLPVVSCLLQADQPWYLGQFVRVARPAGLVSPILFDLSGVKVDNLWETATLVGQIVKLRRDLARNRYEVDLLLTNYSYGRAAKWRAPAARIKSRPGVAQYLIEGTLSDFGEDVSDALSLTPGDELILMTSALGYKGGSTANRTITSITPSGADWLVTLASDFGFVGAAGDWLYLCYSGAYSNTAVVGGEPYPYTWMTSGTSLVKPGPTFVAPDEYS